MSLILSLAMLILSVDAQLARDIDCVGDHHEGCPVLVTSEELVDDPKCEKDQYVSHGTNSILIKATLLLRDSKGLRPATKIVALRECLNEKKEVVRSCPIKLSLEPDGRFQKSIWRTSVGEAICQNGVLAKRAYEETVQLRVKASGCQDLIVPVVWPWKERSLVLDCHTSK